MLGNSLARSFACLILFLVCLSEAYAGTEVSDKSKAEDIVSRFYGFVFFSGESPTFNEIASVKKYFEPEFYNNLIMLMKISGKHEIAEHQLEFLPFTGAQDSADGFIVKNAIITRADSNKIQFPIAFLLRKNQNLNENKNPSKTQNTNKTPNSPKDMNDIVEGWRVTVSLIKTDTHSEWKINDIIYQNQHESLSALAKEAAEYIKSHHHQEDASGYYRW